MFKKGGDFVIFSPNEALLYKNPITKDKSCDHLVFGKPSMKEKKKRSPRFHFHRLITFLLNNPYSNCRSCNCVQPNIQEKGGDFVSFERNQPFHSNVTILQIFKRGENPRAGEKNPLG